MGTVLLKRVRLRVGQGLSVAGIGGHDCRTNFAVVLLRIPLVRFMSEGFSSLYLRGIPIRECRLPILRICCSRFHRIIMDMNHTKNVRWVADMKDLVECK